MATKYTQRSDGRFQAKVWDGTYRGNKKHYINLYSSKSSKDLEKKVQEYEFRLKTGESAVRSDITIGEYADQWLSTYKGMKEASTKRMYERMITLYLKPIRNYSFDYFTLSKLQGIINSLKEHPRTCQMFKLTLKQIGESAEHDKLLPRGHTDDIVKHIELPKYESVEKRPLTEYEKSQIQIAPFTLKQKAFVYILYFCGLRREEVMGLRKDDIRDGRIYVSRAVGFDENSPYIKSTKTARGKRAVPVPAALAEVLNEYTADMKRDDYLFTKSDGGLMTKDSYKAMWRSIQPKIGTDVTAHIFRHNYCTQLCYIAATEHTITTKKIAELLGDTEQMVISVYSHIIEDREAADAAVESALSF